jgi:hypothetical protein
MEVTRYIFQSPYSNQVQVGKPDVSSAQETKGEEPQIIQQSSGKELSDVAVPKAAQTQADTPSQATPEPVIEVSLDTYA